MPREASDEPPPTYWSPLRRLRPAARLVAPATTPSDALALHPVRETVGAAHARRAAARAARARLRGRA